MKKRNVMIVATAICLSSALLFCGCGQEQNTAAKVSTKDRVEHLLEEGKDAMIVSPNGVIPKSGFGYAHDTLTEITEHHEAETHVVHHEAVTHEEPVYETIHHEAETEKVWVVDQEAYDETYEVCDKCGEKR